MRFQENGHADNPHLLRYYKKKFFCKKDESTEIDTMIMVLSKKLNQLNTAYKLLDKQSRDFSKIVHKAEKNQSKLTDDKSDKKSEAQSSSFKNYFNEFYKFCEDYKNYAREIYLKLQNVKKSFDSEDIENKRSNSSLYCLM